MADPDEVEQLARDKINNLVDAGRIQIKARIRRADDHAGVGHEDADVADPAGEALAGFDSCGRGGMGEGGGLRLCLAIVAGWRRPLL